MDKVMTPWGPLGYVVYKRTYSRRLDDNNPDKTEEFNQTVDRIVSACRDQLNVGFSLDEEAEVRDIFLNLKGSVAGRFLWQLGTNTVDRLGLLSLQNCAACVIDHHKTPFVWAMDALMLGSGVGFNIQKEYIYEINKIKNKQIVIERKDTKDADFIVPDSREGWVELLKRTLEAHFETGKGFSYSTVCIRGKGAPIKGFGGTASGAEELCWGMTEINKLLNSRAGKKLRPIDALDVMNIIAYVVVAGNVRRSALLAIGDADDFQYLAAKDWSSGNIPNWRAMSNNSVACNDIKLLPEKFWEGYQGNGEPYGLINLKLSRKVGRLGETEYNDPDVVCFNPCFAGDTLVTTDKGLYQIKDLIGQNVNIFSNGIWTPVNNFRITGKNQSILKLSMQDGSELRVTPNHTMILDDGTRIKANELNIDDSLLISNIESHGTVKSNGAYIKGFLCGDGSLAKDRPMLYLYPPKYVCEGRLIESAMEVENDKLNTNVLTELGFIEQESKGKIRKAMTGLTPKKQELGEWCDKAKISLPKEVFIWDKRSKVEFIAGLFDADGTASDTKNGFLYQLSSTRREFLLSIQTLLKTINVHSKLSTSHEDQERDFNDGYGSYQCSTSYRLTISQASSITLANQVDFSRLISFKNKTIKYIMKPKYNKVVSIEEDGIEDEVYCCTIPETHSLTIGIGLEVGQCAEQSLGDKETCCLAEIFLPNITNKEELFKVAKYLYRINKHSLALPCHLEDTEKIVHKNMRMGIGVTGYLQATEEQRSWLSDTYKELRKFDKLYSKQHNFPESIKLTTVKPSGTLSLLAGVTAGVHPGFSQYYIRRIRMASNSPLAELCRQKGYAVEFQKNFDGTDDRNTLIVEFPCQFPQGTTLAKDCTAIQQLEYVKKLQTEWSDNSVSCTVYYKKEELTDIKEWLKKNYNNSVKTVSFLLHSEHGFAQAPLEEITKERYEELIKNVTPITSGEFGDDGSQDNLECANGACPIK